MTLESDLDTEKELLRLLPLQTQAPPAASASASAWAAGASVWAVWGGVKWRGLGLGVCLGLGVRTGGCLVI